MAALRSIRLRRPTPRVLPLVEEDRDSDGGKDADDDDDDQELDEGEALFRFGPADFMGDSMCASPSDDGDEPV
jgi:hypothetical protein